jgi:hypothetical protein
MVPESVLGQRRLLLGGFLAVAGPIAARVRALGVRAAGAVPIIVDGRVWGLAAVGSVQPGPMPADTEVRISRFAELIAPAVVAGYRAEQKRQLLAEGSQRLSLVDALLEDGLSTSGACGRSPAVSGCRSTVLLWSSPPTFPPWVMSRCPTSSRSCAALTSFRRGGGCLICRVGIIHVASDRKLDRVVALTSIFRATCSGRM